MHRCMNLTTSISHIVFNHDSQLLGIASSSKKAAFRLVLVLCFVTFNVFKIHTGSMTAFSNWPKPQDSLSRVSKFAFSPNSGLLAIGNERGVVQLHKLCSYPNA